MNDNRCVCCGDRIPEGRQICIICERKESKKMKDLLRKAAETIQRLGTQTQDCTSCARLPLCNAYKDGDSFKGCDYKWRCADEVEQYEKS